MSKTLIERLIRTPEEKRLFLQERAIIEVTQLICILMEEEGVSKAELAKRLNTSKANVTQILDGRRNMTIRTVSDILFHLGHALEFGAKNLADVLVHHDKWFSIDKKVEIIKPQQNIWGSIEPKGTAWRQGQKGRDLKLAG